MSRRGTSGSRNSPRRVSAKVKQTRALELRKGGLSYQRIADQPLHPKTDPEGPRLYKDKSAAYKAVQAALAELQAETQETAHEVLALELARLDEMHASMWVRALDARSPDPKAVEIVLKLQERRTKYLGLDYADGLDERFLQVQEHEVARTLSAMEHALDEQGMTPEQVREVLASVAHHLDTTGGPNEGSSGAA